MQVILIAASAAALMAMHFICLIVFKCLHGLAFLLLLYLDDPIFGQLLGLTSLFLTFQPSPLACVVSGFLVHVAGTLCPQTFVYHLYLYLASILFLNHISFLTPLLFCRLAHSAGPKRLSMNWRVLNCRHNNNNNNNNSNSVIYPRYQCPRSVV